MENFIFCAVEVSYILLVCTKALPNNLYMKKTNFVQTHFVQIYKWKHPKNLRNMFKVNNNSLEQNQ